MIRPRPGGRFGREPGESLPAVGREHAGLGLRGRIPRLVGRTAEMQLLRNRLDAAMTGQGQAVGIAGEPGIGKSHLLHEFHQSLADRDVTYLEGRCFSYATTIPYFPVLEILRSTFRVSDTDTSQNIVEKVRQGLEQIGIAANESAPYILHLLGIKEGADHLAALSPDALKARTFTLLSELTLRGSRSRPLVIAVEDLHWIDTASEAYLATLLEHLAAAPVLLVLTYRPGYRPPGAEKSFFTQMALQPLSREDSLKVVQAALETEQISDPAARAILSKAEGNPFFLEELAQVIGAHGDHLCSDCAGNPRRGPSRGSTDCPKIASDFCRPPPDRAGNFRSVLLRDIWDAAAVLDSQLRDLARLEFVFLGSAAQELLYVFKHALMQEVAYEHSPLAQRQALHAAAGRTIEGLYADRLEEVYDRLAYHYSRTDDAVKAIDILSLFGSKGGPRLRPCGGGRRVAGGSGPCGASRGRRRTRASTPQPDSSASPLAHVPRAFPRDPRPAPRRARACGAPSGSHDDRPVLLLARTDLQRGRRPRASSRERAARARGGEAVW